LLFSGGETEFVGFQVLTAASMKDVSEVHITFMIALIMEAVCTCEILVSFT
jgi:hypothetical protein